MSDLPDPPGGYYWSEKVDHIEDRAGQRHPRVTLQLRTGTDHNVVDHAYIDLDMYGLRGVRERAQRMLERLK